MENFVPRIGASKRSSDAPKIEEIWLTCSETVDVGTAAMRRF